MWFSTQILLIHPSFLFFLFFFSLFYCCFFFVWGAHEAVLRAPGRLRDHSDCGHRNWVGHMQGKYSVHCTISMIQSFKMNWKKPLNSGPKVSLPVPIWDIYLYIITSRSGWVLAGGQRKPKGSVSSMLREASFQNKCAKYPTFWSMMPWADPPECQPFGISQAITPEGKASVLYLVKGETPSPC